MQALFRADGEFWLSWHQSFGAFPDFPFGTLLLSGLPDLKTQIAAAPAEAAQAEPIDDYAGDTSTTGTMGYGDQYALGTLETAGDSDWFAIDVSAGDRVRFDLMDRSDSLFGYRFNIYDSNGNNVSQAMYDWGEDIAYFETGGRYYLEVTTTVPDQTGEYVVTANLIPDAGQTPGTAFDLNLEGRPVYGTYDYSGDVDWYGFDVAAGDHVYFEYNDGWGSASPLALFDADGQLVTYLTPTDGGAFGRFFFDYAFSDAGKYFLGIVPGFEYNFSALIDTAPADISSTETLTTDGIDTSFLINAAGDHDYIRFHAEAGETLQFVVANNAWATQTLDMDLRGRAGALLVDGTAGDPGFTYTFTRAGDYFLDISADALSYIILRAFDPEDDLPASVDTTGELNMGGLTHAIFTGDGSESDHDWYRVDLEAGQTLAVTGLRDSSVWNLQFAMYDSNGDPLVSYHAASRVGDDFLLDSYTATEAGTYYLDISSSSVGVGCDILTQVFFDDFLDAAGSSYTSGPDLGVDYGVIPAGGSIHGVLETVQDSDLFSIELEHGQLVHVTLTQDHLNLRRMSLTMGSSTLSGVTLSEVRDTARGVLDVWFLAVQDGTYYIDVTNGGQGFTGQIGGPSGGYTIETVIDPDDFGNTLATAESFGTNNVVQGWIETNNDVDMFKFHVRAGQIVEFECDSQAPLGKGMQYPEFVIYDSYGNELLTIPADYSSANVALIEFAERGVYYISVHAGGGLTNNRVPGTYTLSSTTFFDDVGTDSILTPNQVFGSPNSEGVQGTLWDDVLYGNFGDDTLFGKSGNDFLYGGLGDDNIEPGAGSDTIYYRMGDGSDRIYGFDFSEDHFVIENNPYSTFMELLENVEQFEGIQGLLGSANPVVALYLGDGSMILFDDATVDQLTPEAFGYSSGPDGILTGHGSPLVDLMIGGDTNDAFWGHEGDDFYSGGKGGDWLFGGTGVDHLLGQDGADHLSGGAGSDKLLGGAGHDVFIVGHDSAEDTIADFSARDDRIEFVAESGITDLSQVHMTQEGHDVLIEAGGTHVRLVNVALEALQSWHFVFDAAKEPGASGSEGAGGGDASAPGAVTLLDFDWTPQADDLPAIERGSLGLDGIDFYGPHWALLPDTDWGGHWA